MYWFLHSIQFTEWLSRCKVSAIRSCMGLQIKYENMNHKLLYQTECEKRIAAFEGAHTRYADSASCISLNPP